MRNLCRVGPSALALVLILLSTGTVVAADDKPEPKTDKVDLKALDAYLRKSLYYAIDHGATLHNSGDVKGGYQTFESTLTAVLPLLNHHPDMQAYVKTGLAAAERLPSMEERSFKLREVLDKVRAALKTGEGVPVDKSLWDRLGGEKGVSALIDDFLARALKDPKVNFDRNGKYTIDADTRAKIRKELVKQISYLTNGPDKPDKDAMPPWKGLGITNAEFLAAREDLMTAMAAAHVELADGRELITALDALRKDIVVPSAPAPKTVWEGLGGEKGVEQLVDDFLAQARKDKAVNLDRNGKYTLDDAALAKVKKELVKQISYLTGGPYKFEKEAVPPWKGLGITDTEFDAAAKHFAEALEKSHVSKPMSAAVKEAVVDLRNKVVEGPTVEPPTKALWDRLDGAKGVAPIVADYFAGASKNAKANLDHGGTLKLDDPAVADKIKKALTAQVTAAAGGTQTAEMAALAKSLKVSDAEFDARQEELKKALEKNGLKADDVKAVVSAVEKTRKDVVEAKKPDDTLKEGDVSGVVTVDGKPLASGKIGFSGTDKGADKKPLEGDIKDGKYKLSGLKPGEYRVTITGSDAIGAQYGLVLTTPLKTEITKDKNTQDFKLVGKK